MRAEQVKGLMEAYSHVYETPEVLNEGVVEEGIEVLDEATPQVVSRATSLNRQTTIPRKGESTKDAASRADALEYTRRGGIVGQTVRTLTRGFGSNKDIARVDAEDKASQARIRQRVAASQGKYYSSSDGKTYKNYNDALAAKNSRLKATTPETPTPPGQQPPRQQPPGQQPPRQQPPAATSATSKPTTPTAPTKPAGSAMDQWAKANPKLAAAKAERDRTRGTSATTNPLMKDMKSSLPAPKSPSPSTAKTGFDLAKKGVNLAAGVDIFDLVKGHLLDEGYADSEEGAMVIMVNMSEEWRKSILESYGVEEIDEGKSSRPRYPGGRGVLDQETRDEKREAHAENRKGHTAGSGTVTKNTKKLRKQKAMGEIGEEYMDEAQRARENPEDHDKEEKRKYEPVRGERTPMPPRGDKRREEFEKWYAKQMGR